MTGVSGRFLAISSFTQPLPRPPLQLRWFRGRLLIWSFRRHVVGCDTVITGCFGAALAHCVVTEAMVVQELGGSCTGGCRLACLEKLMNVSLVGKDVVFESAADGQTEECGCFYEVGSLDGSTVNGFVTSNPVRTKPVASALVARSKAGAWGF